MIALLVVVFLVGFTGGFINNWRHALAWALTTAVILAWTWGQLR